MVQVELSLVAPVSSYAAAVPPSYFPRDTTWYLCHIPAGSSRQLLQLLTWYQDPGRSPAGAWTIPGSCSYIKKRGFLRRGQPGYFRGIFPPVRIPARVSRCCSDSLRPGISSAGSRRILPAAALLGPDPGTGSPGSCSPGTRSRHRIPRRNL